MSKYGEVACLATAQARNGIPPTQAWMAAAAKVFASRPSGRDKNCPRCAFLGLAEEGMIAGIPPGDYTKSRDNKRYAIEAAQLLAAEPQLSHHPGELWRRIMQGGEKQHNEQMTVVAALWNAGFICSEA